MYNPEFTEIQNSSSNGIEQLREDATKTAIDIIDGVQENFISNEIFKQYNDQITIKFDQLDRTNLKIMNLLHELNDKIENPKEDIDSENLHPFERLDTPKPNKIHENNSDYDSTNYDLDHDVIMRSRFAYSINQVPEPGNFTGKTSETDLFCQLCEDTFKTYPNRLWPEDAKVNFVKSRLRDAARNWYLTKYKDNTSPATLKELLDELKKAFTNIASKKLTKINLINLKQNYGKINDYIETFRSYSREFDWPEEPLVLFFYNGLHPKYKEEIEKIEIFPTKLEDIITKCILFENSLNTKNRINQASSKKNSKGKNINSYSNTNSKNNNNKNYYNPYNNRYNKNNHYNKSDNNKNSENNDYISKVQKINTKN